MAEIDYQWPTGTLNIPANYMEASDHDRSALQCELEQYFSGLLGFPTLLLPSGRAALSLAFQVLGVGRGLNIFASKWSSHCVWNIVGRYGDPTTRMAGDVDVMLAVYKYGRLERNVNIGTPRIVIEDSCDSLIMSSDWLFPNNGACEIFSLPKIMGSYGGGLLVCADDALANNARSIASRSILLSPRQGYMRWAIAAHQSAEYNVWDANEFQNCLPDYCLLKHVYDNLAALQVNAATIIRRLSKLSERFPEIFSPHCYSAIKHRLPPVIAVPIVSGNGNLMIRHVNITGAFDKPDFRKLALIPVHFGVSETLFNSVLNEIEGKCE